MWSKGTYDNHPILTNNAILPTRSIEEFTNVIAQWLECLIPGGCVHGPFRIGKTCAIKYFRSHGLEALGLRIPSVLISLWNPTQSSLTENRFFEELLWRLGYPLWSSGTAAKKRRRVVALMAEQARAEREHRFILFVDEAQSLSKDQFGYLVDLYNQLKEEGIALVTIMVGQPELQLTKQTLRQEGCGQLLGRFMASMHELLGVLDYDDWLTMLLALDQPQINEYPPGSGCCYSQFFLPEAFNAGWRFHHHADQIWDLLHQVLQREQVPPLKHYPTQALIAIIRRLFKVLPSEAEITPSLRPALVEQVILQVAFEQLEDHAYLYPATTT